MKALIFPFLILFLSFTNQSHSQNVKSLGDINKVKNPLGLVVSQVQSGNNIFFSRTTAAHGNEPWVTDGTPAGTKLLKDIVPGTTGSSPLLFSAAKFGGTYGAYFIAHTPATGYELWMTDGTPAGTKIVQDLYPGIAGAFEEPGIINNILVTSPEHNFAYFAATNGTTGVEPYFSNGVENDITIWADIAAGADSSYPQDFKYLDSAIAFSAETAAAGRELYIISFFPIFDDIYPGVNSSKPNNFFVVGGDTLLYTADDGTTGMELRKYQGGTVLVKDTTPGSTGSIFTTFNQLNNNNVIFSTISMAATPAMRIWKSDGTNAGTVPLKNLNCIPGGIFALMDIEGVSTSRSVNGKLVFPCTEFDFFNFGTGEAEPWVSDGTAAGTKKLKDIAGGKKSSDTLSLVKLNNKLLFFANDHKRGFEPWITDGTEAGTKILKDFNKGTASSGDYFSILLGAFLNNNHTSKVLMSLTINNNRKVFITDGEAANTVELFDDSTNRTGDSSPSGFVGIGENIIFAANTGANGRELFQTKGTKKSTKILKNIVKGGDSSPTDLIKLSNEQIIFSANHPEKGKELFTTDGTTKGTKLLRDVNVGNFGSSPVIFKNKLKKKIFFAAKTAAYGDELWVTNGTRRGTKLVKDIAPGLMSSSPQDLVILKGKAIFRADSDFGNELWISNSKASGTKLLKDLFVGIEGSNPSNLVKLKDKIIFAAYTPDFGRELYVTDGTETGTKILKDINAGANSSSPDKLTVSGNFVYFTANNNVNGIELWRTDGTEIGTVMILDFTPGASNTSFGEISAVGNDQVVLLINHPAAGRELHLATPNSITLLKDINAGASDSDPENFYKIPNKNLVYFSAYTPALGYELYRTDGTSAGTVLVKDITPGPSYSSPHSFYFYKKKLFFSARNDLQGDELHVVKVN